MTNFTDGIVSMDMVFEAIRREREWQRRTWSADQIPLPSWLLILEGELDEAKQTWRNGTSQGGIDALFKILQVAATAVACLEQQGIAERRFS